MAIVTFGDQKREYPLNTTFKEIAKDFQMYFNYDILLVYVDGRLRELHKTLQEDCKISFVTGEDKPGIHTYHRSATLLMLKAFYEVVGVDNIEKVSVEFSLGKGYFIKPKGKFVLSKDLLRGVRERMTEYVNQEIPLMKRSIDTDDAMELFRRHKMYDKEKLFRYRRVSRVNIYNLDGFEDYYYGYMVQNTGYLKYFDLIPYENGFMLMLPQADDPRRIAPFEPKQKLFQVLKESSAWGERLQVANVGALNEVIAKGRINELILVQEALQEKKIAEIADKIKSLGMKKFVMIAGPSSSGKTTFSHRLSIQLKALGLNPHPIAVDDYFINRIDTPKDEYGNYDYEALECIDLNRFNRDMSDLLKGKTVQMPRYNFKRGEREYHGDFLTLTDDDILVIEGIHCLNDKMSADLPMESKYKIYVSALTQLNIDEHNRIPTTDARLLRRMVRDARTRGTCAHDTLARWSSVRRGEEKNIFPYQEEADIMFNSAAVYELAVLKQYVEPLLFAIDGKEKEYQEAKRLLKFLDYFLGINDEMIPRNSIVREFIGGSCFRV